MKFGGMVATKIDDWEIFPYLESLGYDSGWVPDSQMIWSDCYATLTLAAWHTSRLRLELVLQLLALGWHPLQHTLLPPLTKSLQEGFFSVSALVTPRCESWDMILFRQIIFGNI